MKTDKSLVKVVIPIYKNQFSSTEITSLNRTFEVLINHIIVVV
jgi:hypothetical protein